MHKILVIRFSSIGDIVLTTPVVRCLKTQLPFSEIHYLTKEVYHPILVSNPYIDKILTLEEGLSNIAPKIRAEKYDYIVDLHHNLRTLSLTFRTGLKFHSFHKLNLEKWMMVNLKINKLPKKHIVDRYFDTVKGLKVKNDLKGLDYFIPKHDEVPLNSLPECHRKGFIAFVIGARHNTKKLPVEKIISICKRIEMPIVLLGGEWDKANGDAISAAIGSKIFNAAGSFNLNQSASIIRHSKKVISHDTGLMHIASAFGKELISIWGSTIPEFGMSPYMPQCETLSHIVHVNDLKCRPCSKIGYERCPKTHFNCMNLIDEQTIAQLANR